MYLYTYKYIKVKYKNIMYISILAEVFLSKTFISFSSFNLKVGFFHLFKSNVIASFSLYIYLPNHLLVF